MAEAFGVAVTGAGRGSYAAAIRAASFPFLVSCLASTLDSYYPGGNGTLLLLGALLIFLGWWLAGLARMGIALFRRRWDAAGRRLVLLAISIPLAFVGFQSGDWVHLATSYPYYLYRIGKTSERPVRFYWGDTAVTVFDANRVRTLLYDDSGRTKAAVGVDRQDPSGLRIGTTHMTGNFFMELAVE